MSSLPSGVGLADHEVMVYGLGAHKSGSTWLHYYLKEHPSCFASTQKELNYFSTATSEQVAYRSQAILRKLNELTKRIIELSRVADTQEDAINQLISGQGKLFDLTQAIAILSGYGAYFDAFRRRDIDQTHCVDISPLYANVSADTIEEMRDMHVSTKFIYLMRDPADRVFSSLKYEYQMNAGKVNPLDPPKDDEQRLAALIAHFEADFCANHSDYLHTLDNLDRVVLAEDQLILFYENLFNDESMKLVCEFLEIDFKIGPYSKIENPSKNLLNQPNMTDSERKFLVEALSTVYKEIDDRFGDLAPDAWNWPDDIQKTREVRAVNCTNFEEQT